MLRANEKKCTGLDKMWKVKKQFLLAMIGSGGETMLMSAFRQLMPSALQQKELEDVAGGVQQLLLSPLYKFAGKPVQGVITTAAKLVLRLNDGDPPMPMSNSCTFVAEIFGKLGWFFEFEVMCGEGKAAKKEVRKGAVGAQLMLGFLERSVPKVDNKEGMEMLEKLGLYDFLLKPHDKQKFDQLVESVFEGDEKKGKTGKLKGSAGSSKGGGSAEPNAKKRKLATEKQAGTDKAELEATSLMFQ